MRRSSQRTQKVLEKAQRRAYTYDPPRYTEWRCFTCGRVMRTRYRGTFCSPACRQKYNDEHAFCAYCGRKLSDLGIHFPDKEITSQTILFCNDKCKEEYKWRQAREKGRVRICKYCGKEFIDQCNDSRMKLFCSKACRQQYDKEHALPKDRRVHEICIICGKDFEKPIRSTRKTCSLKCAQVYRGLQISAQAKIAQATKGAKKI